MLQSPRLRWQSVSAPSRAYHTDYRKRLRDSHGRALSRRTLETMNFPFEQRQASLILKWQYATPSISRARTTRG